jgi:hypothetical protein
MSRFLQGLFKKPAAAVSTSKRKSVKSKGAASVAEASMLKSSRNLKSSWYLT